MSSSNSLGNASYNDVQALNLVAQSINFNTSNAISLTSESLQSNVPIVVNNISVGSIETQNQFNNITSINLNGYLQFSQGLSVFNNGNPLNGITTVRNIYNQQNNQLFYLNNPSEYTNALASIGYYNYFGTRVVPQTIALNYTANSVINNQSGTITTPLGDLNDLGLKTSSVSGGAYNFTVFVNGSVIPGGNVWNINTMSSWSTSTDVANNTVGGLIYYFVNATTFTISFQFSTAYLNGFYASPPTNANGATNGIYFNITPGNSFQFIVYRGYISIIYFSDPNLTGTVNVP